MPLRDNLFCMYFNFLSNFMKGLKKGDIWVLSVESYGNQMVHRLSFLFSIRPTSTYITHMSPVFMLRITQIVWQT